MTRRLVGIVVTAGAVFVATTVSSSSRALQQPVHEVNVVAKTFAFEPSEIHVVAGEPVRLVLRSADSVHGFAIRALKIDVVIPRSGDPVVAEFTAPSPGRYDVACSEFCGRGHAQMKAALVSTAPARTNQ